MCFWTLELSLYQRDITTFILTNIWIKSSEYDTDKYKFNYFTLYSLEDTSLDLVGLTKEQEIVALTQDY